MPTLFCGSVSCPTSPGAERPARSAGASRPGARGGGGAPCAGSPAADGRTISHEAIYTWIHTPSRGRNLVGARDRAALTALGAQGGPRRRVVSPRSWACG